MRVLIRGSGDVASAIAYQLFGLGYQVLIHELVKPAYIRRGMAFTDAVFDGKADLQGVWAKLPETTEDIYRMLDCGRAIPVLTHPLAEALQTLKPDVLVDARMLKRNVPEAQIGWAPLTIGLGPNFVVGQHTDIVIETAWGDHLGQIVDQGAALPLTGDPREIMGLGRERCVYAAVAGEIKALVEIGAWVEAGDAVAQVGSELIYAPISGYIRGICHSGVQVSVGSKVVEFDPRTEGASLYGLGERPLRLAEAVVSALLART